MHDDRAPVVVRGEVRRPRGAPSPHRNGGVAKPPRCHHMRPAGLASLPKLGLYASMPEPYADALATVAAGRTALVERLRTIDHLLGDRTVPYRWIHAPGGLGIEALRIAGVSKGTFPARRIADGVCHRGRRLAIGSTPLRRYTTGAPGRHLPRRGGCDLDRFCHGCPPRARRRNGGGPDSCRG